MSLRTYVAKKVGIHVCSSPFSSPDNFIFLATLAALGRTAAGADGVFFIYTDPMFFAVKDRRSTALRTKLSSNIDTYSSKNNWRSQLKMRIPN